MHSITPPKHRLPPWALGQAHPPAKMTLSAPATGWRQPLRPFWAAFLGSRSSLNSVVWLPTPRPGARQDLMDFCIFGVGQHTGGMRVCSFSLHLSHCLPVRITPSPNSRNAPPNTSHHEPPCAGSPCDRGTALSTALAFFHLILTINLRPSYHLHFTDEETVTQRRE